MTDTLDSPAVVITRLQGIERDLEKRQNAFEDSARKWFKAKRDREHEYAIAFVRAEGTDGRRRAEALRETAMIGAEEEAEWEALKAVTRILETRASIGQSILRAQGR